MHIKKLAVNEENFVYPIEDLNRSLTVSEGRIDREELIAANHEGMIKTSTGKELLLVPASFKDNMNAMQRRAAIIIPKDVGFIISETGLTKDAVVIDSGAGSGGVTCQLAALCKKVYSYDVNEKHVEVVKENCKRLDLDNVICEHKDIVDVEPVEQADLVVLDLPDVTVAIPFLQKALKQGGYVVFYTPHANQAQKVITALAEVKQKGASIFRVLRTIELIQRDWEIDEVKLRPKHQMLGHTAFLTIARIFRREE